MDSRSPVIASFDRPDSGPIVCFAPLPSTGLPGWRSRGGASPRHPDRALPIRLDGHFVAPQALERIHLLGVFAIHEADPETVCAAIQVWDGETVRLHKDLIAGRHVFPSTDVNPRREFPGDGVSIETVGTVLIDGCDHRVDLISVDVIAGMVADRISVVKLDGPSSFVLFEMFADVAPLRACPFRERQGQISLSELPSILRLSDRSRFARAVAQLEVALRDTQDLDEARGQALTFLAVVTASTLEMGGGRSMHRVQLECARKLDALDDIDRIVDAAVEIVHEVADPLFAPLEGPSAHLIQRALKLVDRNFADRLTDAAVAARLGLSTSHFRYLFRQATGQPFHQYVLSARLERARLLLAEGAMSVRAVAEAVGFSGVSHFSKAFAQRFDVSPTGIRRVAD